MIKTVKPSKLRTVLEKIGSGITPRGGEKAYSQTGIPLIRSQNVRVGYLDLSDVVYIDDIQHSKMKNSQVLPGDVLLNITGASIGRSCVAPDWLHDANVNQHVCILRPSKKVNSHYLSAFLNSFEGQKQIFSFQGGGSREGLNYQQIGSMLLELPSRIEQDRIAEILTTWDEAIGLVERTIGAKKKRKKALANYYLQKASHWKHEKLEKLVDLLTDGTHQSPKSKEGAFKYITSRNIRPGKLDLTDVQYISAEEHRQIYSCCPVEQGDVLLTKDGVNAGNATLNPLPEPFSVLSSVAVIRGKQGVLHNPFLVQFILSDMGQRLIKSEVSGQAITRLTLKQMQSFKIPIPHFEEQKKIAEALFLADSEIDLAELHLSLLKFQKRGLMQKLLTGKWRVSTQEVA